MAVVSVRGPLRKLADGHAEHDLDGATVLELLRALELRHPDVRGWILDERGVIRRHINVFVNGERGDAATAVRIQYGGSVTPGTAAALLGADSVDRFLVGGASLDAGQFAAIVLAGA